MDVRVETLSPRLCVCLRHVGPYGALGPSFGRAIRWVAQTGRRAPEYRVIGLSYDHPGTVPAAALRYDVCVTIADDTAPLPADLRYERIGDGRWAIHTLRGSYSGLACAFGHLRNWLHGSGEALDDRPFMEIYLNDAGDVPEAELLTDVCIPLKA